MAPPSAARDTLERCIKELTGYLEGGFQLSNVHTELFSVGDHAVSVPLEVQGRIQSRARTLFAKVVTHDGVRVHRGIARKKNSRFRMHGIEDVTFQEFDSAHDLLSREAQFLQASRAVGIHVPSFYDLCDLPTCAALVLEFVQGAPLERSDIQQQELVKVFSVIRQLREHRLVHGDLRRDNFLLTASSDVYLVDYLPLAGFVERLLDYDLISAVCHLSLSVPPLLVLDMARRFFPPTALKSGLPFLNFITERLTDHDRVLLERAISTM